MAIIDFPSSPSVNDTYSFGNKTWVFNGQGWQLASTGAINDVVIGNITPASGNFTTVGATGNITASGNVQGQYILGNGAFLTGISAGSSYSNANVAAYLPNYQGLISNVDFRSTSPAAVALVVTDRPLTMGGNSLSYVTLPDDGNANSVAAELTNHGLGNVLISAGPADYEWIFDHTGNLTLPGSTFAVNYANGAQVSLAGTYSNVNVKAYLESGSMINANFDGGTLYATGIANLGPTTINGNLTVAGNITASGNLTYINVQDLVIDDPLIQLAANNPGDTEDLGIVAGYNDGTARHTGFARDYTDQTWKVFTGVTSDPNTVIAWSQAVYAPFKAGPILSNASITANANVTATGNVSGSYLLGNGYFISGIQYSNITGTYGNSNVAAYLPVYTGNLASLTGNVITTANVTGNFLLGNGAFITGLPAGYSNADVANYLASNAAVTLLTTGNITTQGNVAGAWFIGNINATNTITTTGNITANNFIGSDPNVGLVAGSYTWLFDNTGNFNLPANTFNVNYANGVQVSLGGTYSNAEAANYLASNANVTILTTGNITTQGNITGNYILGNGALLTGLPATYSNANVANYLPTYTGNLASLTGNVTTTANVAGAWFIGNINATNTITTTGNITANNFIGSDPNVGLVANGYTWLFDNTGNVTLPGNVWAVNYANGTPVSLAGTYANSNVATYLASNAAVTILTTGNITTAANVSGAYIIGNGAFLTDINAGNIIGSYGNSQVAAYLQVYNGNASFSNVTVSRDMVVLGNLRVEGNTTEINVSNIFLADKDIIVAANANATLSDLNGAGLQIGNRTAGGNITFFYDSTSNVMSLSHGANIANVLNVTGNITATGNVTANFLLGNIRSATGGYNDANVAAYTGALTNLTGNVTTTANVSGAYLLGNGAFITGLPAGYSNADVANYLPTYTGNVGAGNLNLTGNIVDTGAIFVITGANGNVVLAPNGTSRIIATTSGANVVGNLDVAGNVNANGATLTGNLAAGNLSVANGNITVGNLVGAGTNVEIVSGAYTWTFDGAGNLTGNGNISAGNFVGTAGNTSIVTGAYAWVFNDAGNLVLPGNGFSVNYANGTQVSLGGSYSNSEAANYLASNAAVTILTTGNITTAANVAGNYFIGNGALLTGLPATYSNSNVAAYLASNSNITLALGTGNITTQGNVTAGNLSVANGNITLGNLVGSGTNVEIVSGAYTWTFDGAGNLTGNGNISAGNFVGTAGNTSIVTNAYSWTFNDAGNLVLPGNTFAVNYANGTQVSLSGTYSNTNVAAYLPTYTGAINSLTGNVTTTANMEAAYFIGNGAFLTSINASNIVGSYGNSQVAAYLQAYNGNALFGNVTVSQDAVILGNLRVEGNTTYINVTDLVIEDKDIIVAANATATMTDLNGAGLQIGNRTAGGNITFFYDSTSNVMALSHGANIANVLNVAGNVTATYLLGNGYFVSGIQYSNITGTYGNANVAAYLPTYTGNLQSLTGNVTTTANVAGAFLLGNIRSATGGYDDANVAAYTGALTNLTGNVTTTANVTANYFLGNGAFLTGMYSNLNVANYLPTYTGNVSAGNLNLTGNIVDTGALTIITGANGNITLAPNSTSVLIATSLGINIAGYLNTTGNLSAGNVIGSGNNVEVTAGSYNWAFDNTGNFTLSGNTFAVNYANGTAVSIAGTYSNTNVAAYLASNAAVTILTTANITTSANIAGNYFIGNGALLTGVVTSSYSNANVANYLPTYTGNVSAGNLNLTGNIVDTGALTIITGSAGNITLAPNNTTVLTVTTTGVNVSGTFNATGNISAGNLIGSGNNVEVTAGSYNWVFDNTGNFTLAGNTFGINYANGSQVSLSGTYSNTNVAAYLPTYTGAINSLTGNVTTTANVSGAYLLGNGYFVSGIQYSNITGAYGNANVKTYLESGATINANFGGGNIATTGFANLGITQVNGNLVVTGNISATGNITYINVSDLVVSDPLLFLAANNPGDTEDIGLVANYNPGSGNLHTGFARDYTDGTWKVFQGVTSNPNTVIAWNEAIMAPFKAGSILSNATITANANVVATGNVSGTYLLGNGYFVSGIQYSNITGAYSNATVANYLASNAAVDILTTGNITSSGNVAGNFLLGNIRSATGGYDDANVAAYTGALTNLTGNVTTSANVSGAFLLGNIRSATGGYGDDNVKAYLGNFDGNVIPSANITYSLGSNTNRWNDLYLNNSTIYIGAQEITANADSTNFSGNISAGYIFGNGAFLTSVAGGGSYGNANVADYLASNANVTILTTGNISTSANFSANNIVGPSGSNTTITTNGYRWSFNNAGNLVLPGNTFAVNYANGTQVSLSGSYSNTNVANYLTTYNGNALFSNITVSQDAVILGNLRVEGNTTYINVTDLVVEDKDIIVAANASATLTDLNGAGLQIGNRTAGGNITFFYDSTSNVMSLSHGANIANVLNVTGNITATGNATTGNLIANYIYGDISNATNGFGNNAVLALLSSNTSYNITTTGGITANTVQAQYLYGNGTFITGLSGNFGNANLVAYGEAGWSGNIIPAANGAYDLGNNTRRWNDVYVNDSLYLPFQSLTSNSTRIIASSSLSAYDFISTNDITAAANITATGNVSGSYVLGNIRFATGGYNDANVAAYTGALINLTGNVTTTANVQGAYVLGNIRSATGGYDDANVAAYTGALTNLTGNVTTTANLQGAYVLGNGAFLTGIAASSYSNANVANYLPTYTGALPNLTGNVVTTANVQGGYILGNGYFLSGISGGGGSTYGNANVGDYLASNAAITVLTTANITTAANVAGNYFIGNGAFLTGLNFTNYSNANVANYLASNAAVTITTTANISSSTNVNAGNFSGTGVNTNIRTGSQLWTFGSTGTLTIPGNVNANNYYINNLTNPVQDQDAATKIYVDNLASTSISYHEAVLAATTGTLAAATGGTITYNQVNGVGNGIGATLTTTGSFNLIDTANVQTANTRILVKNEANGAHNGVYVWSNATAITRASTENTAGVANVDALGINDYFYTTGGNVNKGSAFIVDAPNTAIVFGTSNIQFAVFSQSQVYSANTAAGISLATTTISAKVDNDTTAFDGGGNISVKAGANLVTPNIGAATGTSLNVTGNITSSANISGANFVGGSSSNTTIRTGVYNWTFGNTGNFTLPGNTFAVNYANGAQVSLGGSYSNADVANYLPTFTGNVSAGNLNLSGNIVDTGAISVITGASGNVSLAPNGTNRVIATTSGANIVGTLDVSGDIIPSANITYSLGSNTSRWNDLYLNNSTIYIGTQEITANESATNFSGNIAANYLLGNGALLTGIAGGGGGSYGNSNVADYLASNAAVTIRTTANITSSANVAAGNFVGSASNTTIKTGAYTWTFDQAGNLNINSASGTIVGSNANTTIQTGANAWNFASDGRLYLPGNIVAGYRDIPQLSWTGSPTLALGDEGKHYYTASGGTTINIPTNSTVPFPIGTAITLVNHSGSNCTINTSGLVSLFVSGIGGGTVPQTRTLGAYSVATLIKVNTNVWFVSGNLVV